MHFLTSHVENFMYIICKCESLRSRATLADLVAKVSSIIYKPTKAELEISFFWHIKV